jgi:hypothetical protein
MCRGRTSSRSGEAGTVTDRFVAGVEGIMCVVMYVYIVGVCCV